MRLDPTKFTQQRTALLSYYWVRAENTFSVDDGLVQPPPTRGRNTVLSLVAVLFVKMKAANF